MSALANPFLQDAEFSDEEAGDSLSSNVDLTAEKAQSQIPQKPVRGVMTNIKDMSNDEDVLSGGESDVMSSNAVSFERNEPIKVDTALGHIDSEPGSKESFKVTFTKHMASPGINDEREDNTADVEIKVLQESDSHQKETEVHFNLSSQPIESSKGDVDYDDDDGRVITSSADVSEKIHKRDDETGQDINSHVESAMIACESEKSMDESLEVQSDADDTTHQYEDNADQEEIVKEIPETIEDALADVTKPEGDSASEYIVLFCGQILECFHGNDSNR